MIINLMKKVKFERFMKPVMPIGSWYMRVSPRMITCKQFNDFVFDYTEGLLTDKQKVLFERHMRVCPMCRNFMETYQAAFKAGKACFPYSDEEVPHSVPDDLLEAIHDVSSS